MAETARVALVTGAGSGIGRTVALALLDAGWCVALAGRRAAALAETASLAGEAMGRVLCLPADIAEPAQVAALFDALAARFGRLDFLFNNAGLFQAETNFGDLDFATWRAVARVNLDGAFLVAQAAFRMMRDQHPRGGRIVNNGSISAHVPRPGSAAYAATKHGLTGLTRAIALDGREFGIACGQIDIGNAATDMAAPMVHGMRQADGSRRPEPVMDVAQVGEAVRLMASLPPEANIPFLTIMATAMPYLGRG